MDIFVKNLPEGMTETQINRYFSPHLSRFDIQTYRCQKRGRKGCAVITVLDALKAEAFLKVHGQVPRRTGTAQRTPQQLFHMGKPTYCCVSTSQPDHFVLLSLQRQEKEQSFNSNRRNPAASKPNGVTKRVYKIRTVWCGQFDYKGGKLGFAAHYQLNMSGSITFTNRKCFIILRTTLLGDTIYIEIPYHSIDSFAVSSEHGASLVFSLHMAPRFFAKTAEEAFKDMVFKTQQMNFANGPVKERDAFHRSRTCGIDAMHASIASSCLCYRFALENPQDIVEVKKLKRISQIPPLISIGIPFITQITYTTQMKVLNELLADSPSREMPFGLKFQVHKLALNSYLGPLKTLELYKAIERKVSDENSAAFTEAVAHLFSQLPFRGPNAEASEFAVDDLVEQVTDWATKTTQRPFTILALDAYDHIMLIYKAIVTPVGIYLEEPTPEVKNRVLRKYSAFPTHFLSVSFLDEDGELYRYDAKTSGDAVYHRYGEVLNGKIHVGGRAFEFLGFSHSSLRAHTCWFMAPFIMEGSQIDARSLVRQLGDFSHIRSPAKCAARIGQTFSQTLSSIQIPVEAIKIISDVKRNGRCFSDGVGTCSEAILHKIWDVYSRRHALKPTVFQIRFQGAKGMISPDPRLKGEVLSLRPSMIKFDGANATDIEICGSGKNPLPMFLNRPLIKILEDLGVEREAFLALQADAVEQLRSTTNSASRAASFLENNAIGIEAQIPWLLRQLEALNLNFLDDDLLRNVVEVALLRQLQEMKYRGRIPVQNGVTLYGIMDETGFLNEGEIFCCVASKYESHIITGNVVITRSPALHPGDVQCVTAVQVPTGHPLAHLHNVVVFSSKGERDLPSMLSGGDLDGDLYNIIYETALYPKSIHEPADYKPRPAIDIGRTVEATDIIKHFLDFMRNDSLGRIATLHQILADQDEAGTCADTCKVLAALHSDAVDFSKTGIPVAQRLIPPYPKARPDFLSTGPRVTVQKTIQLESTESPPVDEIAKELDEAQHYEPAEILYYESPKVLGHLFRGINEQRFLDELQEQAKESALKPNHSVLGEVWNYVRSKCALIQWNHLIPAAKDIKESYEENIIDSMFSYSGRGSRYISEIEVFSGIILGRRGPHDKRLREYSKELRNKHDRDVAYTVQCITMGLDDFDDDESFARSIACFYVGLIEERAHKSVGALSSFAWVAAMVCLKELANFLRA